ncbi:shufflon system plasmid conjugative transfer pilus tip adhesin PilV [Paraburkholderia sp. BCC1885]|uniref:shufflon system plasmid conjugative transfer pilus tip adhesin PilV n=1 Tax=Paraburkholderia sp. BCC1885 TaxID=2562669 RepID=UPI00118317B5|nr:shufflon system plasmid conjugative transfer pilus tip adhesin PilV [Paraburkholderia sp. BCC1885]
MDAIVGYIVALALSVLGAAGFAAWARVGVTNVQTAAAAGQLLLVDKAAQQYVQDNSAVIAQTATAATPATITPQMLVSAGYLPAGFSPTNLFGQTWLLQVLQPVAGQLQSLVTSQGGRAISDTKELVQIAAQAGAQGGFVPYANQGGDTTMSTANAYGAYGGWRVPLVGYTNPGSGHLASLLAFTGAQANGSYLYRVQIPGQPQLNAMQTDLGMTDSGGTAHNITGAATVQGDQAILAGGPSGSLNVGAAQFYGDTANAAVRQPGGLYIQTPGGAGPADLSEVNNINASGTVSAPILNFNTAPATCAWGQATVRGDNVLYICNQWGNWVLASQMIGNVLTAARYLNEPDGGAVGKPTCTGGTATAAIIPQTTGENVAADPPWESTIYRLVDEGTWWYVQITLYDPYGNAYSGGNLNLSAEVDTQCQYANT